jgi:hypothetical protein
MRTQSKLERAGAHALSFRAAALASLLAAGLIIGVGAPASAHAAGLHSAVRASDEVTFQSIADASLDLLNFVRTEVTGCEPYRFSPSMRPGMADAPADGRDSMTPTQQTNLARLPERWETIRSLWPLLSEDQRDKFRARWATQFSRDQSDNDARSQTARQRTSSGGSFYQNVTDDIESTEDPALRRELYRDFGNWYAGWD